MLKTATATLQPRKTPLQARSSASVEAILEATIQVLVAVGKERLTTTRVAARAGVSVGTLYQYFPNKSALLQACLRRHVDRLAGAMEQVSERYLHQRLDAMVEALVQAYLAVKLAHTEASIALYAVSSDVDGAAISRAAQERVHRSVVALFATTSDRVTRNPEMIATVALAVMNGIVRRLLLEASDAERQVEPLRQELLAVLKAYVRDCVQPSVN